VRSFGLPDNKGGGMDDVVIKGGKLRHSTGVA